MRVYWATLFTILVSAPAFAGSVTYDFSDGTLDGLTPFVNSPGYSYTISGGVLNVSATAGTGNGSVFFGTPFNVSGDFTATVDVSRSGLVSGGDIGLEMNPSAGV